MKKNMGRLDRLLRTVAGITILFFYIRGDFEDSLAPAFLVVAGALIITSIFGVCPIYSMIGINTCAKIKKPT